MIAAVTRDLEGRHRRCLPALARLGMLAGGHGEEALTPGLTAEISLLMDEIQRELDAACRVLLGRPDDAKGPLAVFLSCRRTRLEVAAAGVREAARSADRPALCRALQRFRALVTATWAVHRGVAAHAPVLVLVPRGRRSLLVVT